MHLISSRGNFWSCDVISDRDEIRDVTLTDPDPQIDMPVDVNTLLADLSGKKTLLLIHGYNNDEDQVCRAYQIIQEKVGVNAYDKVMGYTWPGGHVLEYLPARDRAKAVAPRLAKWLELLLTHCASVDIMCHSLGNFLALRAVRYVNPNLKKFRFGWMTAAAVHDESVEPGREFFNATLRFEQFCIYHSCRDEVLALAFPLAEGDRALGLCGPEDTATIQGNAAHIKVINCKHKIAHHSDYKTCAAIYQDMNQRIAGTLLPQYLTL
ncbi:MAG: alpha/beta hydrolase [Polyangiaceae bacterium]